MARACVPAQSSTLVRSSTGEALFNSKLGAPSHSATEARRVAPLSALTGWKAWAEPITSAAAYPPATVVSSSAPVEMTNVTRGLTTFAVYQARLSANTTASMKLKLPTWQAMAFAAFVDGVAAGAADDHSHSNGRDITLSIDLAAASGAGSTLTLLAESLATPTTASRRRGRRGCRPRRRWMARRWRARGRRAPASRASICR